MPDLDPLKVHRLAECGCVGKAENVLLVGGGTGKTRLLRWRSQRARRGSRSGSTPSPRSMRALSAGHR